MNRMSAKCKAGVLTGIACLLLLAVIVSCGGKKSVGPAPDFGVSDFPMDIGTQWRYSVRDLQLQTTKTVDVRIVGTTTLAAGAPRVWVYTGLHADADTVFVTRTADTVKFYDRRDTEYATVERYLVFPLEPGSSWGPLQFWDSLAVVGVAPKTVPAGTFNHAFLVYQEGFIPNNPFNRTEWFVPDVGLIYGRYYSFFTLEGNGSKSESVWELESFTVPE